MKRVIISGATGAIGMALIGELLADNVEVLVLCRKGSARNSRLPEHPLLAVKYAALGEYESTENDTGKSYDVFYHFAWDGTFGNSRNDMFLQNRNVKYALDAVALAKRFGCKKFVGAGSQAEYGRVEGILRPETPVNPENGYGIAKLCAGVMTREYAHSLGLSHSWVRILSVYGTYDGNDTMVSSTIRKLKNGETPEFTKGEQVWDYLYSGDAAEAFRLVGEKGKDGKVYVLGSGQARPLAEYIREIRAAVNPDAEIRLGAVPYSAKQVMYLCADISELTADTAWTPKTAFADGIRSILTAY